MKNNKKYTTITGASSGIGYATAKAFAKRGKNLIVAARRKDELEKLKTEVLELNPTLEVIIKACDLSVLSNVHQFYNGLNDYCIETWINNAGFGNYNSVANQNLKKIEAMLRLNVEALTILSSLYVRDYKDIDGTQLINISSRGGYIIVPNAVTYCAAKFYVSVFTEGLARELKTAQAKLQAKILAPAATQTEFGKIANSVTDYDYDVCFGNYHTSTQVADFLLRLYDGDKTIGAIDGETLEFCLKNSAFEYAGNAACNQKIINDLRRCWQ